VIYFLVSLDTKVLSNSFSFAMRPQIYFGLLAIHFQILNYLFTLVFKFSSSVLCIVQGGSQKLLLTAKESIISSSILDHPVRMF